MARLRAREAALVDETIGLDHAPRHHQHEAESEVGGRLGHDRRHHGDRDLSFRGCGDIDIVGRDRLRRDKTQFRVCCDHVPIDPVVQQRKQDIAAAHGGDQLALRDDAGRIGIDLHGPDLAQAGDRALRDRLADEDAWTHQPIHRTTPATPRPERRPGCGSWRRVRRAPWECRARARARRDAKLTRRARQPRRRRAAKPGSAPVPRRG